MSHKVLESRRVLAIAPKCRGFGFIVMESHTTPIDWGVRTSRGTSVLKEIETVSKVRDLLDQYRPSHLVLEKSDPSSHRGDRIRLLLETIQNAAVWEKIRVRRLSKALVGKIFLTFNARTKQEIATAIAQLLPELAAILPPERKAWMSEDYHMAVFDAAALVLTFFYAGKNRKLSQKRPPPYRSETSPETTASSAQG